MDSLEMHPRIAPLDFDRLERDGFLSLPALVRPEELAAFERAIALAGTRLAAARNIAQRSDDAIADVLRAAGKHRTMLFDYVKRLLVLERLSAEIGSALEEAGLFAHSGIEVPVVWPTLRADLPDEPTYLLQLHQDYKTTRSRSAWRLWVPLRDANSLRGTMEIAPGSHLGGPYRYVSDALNPPSIPRSELEHRGFDTVTVELQAGSAILFDPRLVHGSIPNRSTRTKWVLLIHVQDLTQFVNPEDPADPVIPFLRLSEWTSAASKP
jgi:hypothetical protein